VCTPVSWKGAVDDDRWAGADPAGCDQELGGELVDAALRVGGDIAGGRHKHHRLMRYRRSAVCSFCGLARRP